MRLNRSPSLLHRGLAVALAWALVFATDLARAAASPDRPPTEHEVKAAFLYKVAKYVTWPVHAFASRQDPILIGVLGDDSFGDDLASTVRRERSVHGRSLRVLHSRNAADLVHCHLLFISASEKSRLAQHLATLERSHSHALTVGQTDDFLAAGGAIRFFVENQKVRFEVNLRAAESAGLVISSKLLHLARKHRPR